MRMTAAKIAGLASLALLVALSGCGDTGTLSSTSAPVTLIIKSITPNNASAPFGDVITDSGGLPEDQVTVNFISRMKNVSDLTQPSLQEIIIERYEVTFSRTDGGSAVPAGFSRAMNAAVRVTPHESVNEQITSVALVIVPSTHKAQPPLSFLISPGFEPSTGFLNLQTTATMTFFGKTVAGDPITVTGSIGINFADFAG